MDAIVARKLAQDLGALEEQAEALQWSQTRYQCRVAYTVGKALQQAEVLDRDEFAEELHEGWKAACRKRDGKAVWGD